MFQMPKVSDCTVTKCAYNHSESCNAAAITVGDGSNKPLCDTYFQSSINGGIKDITAGVGACKISDCSYNEELECSAPSIHVGMQDGNADCLTFERR